MDSGFKITEILQSVFIDIRKQYKGTDEEFNDLVKDKLPKILEGVSNIVSSAITNLYKRKILSELKLKEEDFNARLFKEYRDGLEYLQIFVDLNKYLGKNFLKQLEKVISNEDKLKLGILLRLHARACQVSTEILTLLKYGYPDGAHARWRTLHEIAVIFLILIESNNNTIEMFADYQYIDKLKKAKSFQTHHESLNWPPIDESKLEVLEEKRASLKEKYGNDFTKSYGWTLNLIENRGERHFKKLEEIAGLDYLRPFYSWACENIHVGMDGISNRMSLYDSSSVSYLMFTGPSQYGLADPAQFTTFSLLSITSALISIDESYENMILKSLLESLHEKSSSSFFKRHKEMKEEFKEIYSKND